MYCSRQLFIHNSLLYTVAAYSAPRFTPRDYGGNRMRYLITALVVLLSVTQTGYASEENVPNSGSFEFKLSHFKPELSEWDTYYEKEPNAITLGWSYKILRPLEVGASIGYMTVDGKGQLVTQNALGGKVDMTLVPVDISLVYRFVFSEEQLLVPYVGGGLTRIYYRQRTSDGKKAEGSHNGNHIKAGLQLLLDRLDKNGALKLQERFGIENSYLYLEGQKTKADESQIDLGGEFVSLGVLFEY